MLNHAAMIMMSQPEDMSEWFCVDFTNSTVDGSVTISNATKNSFRTNMGMFSAGETIAVPKGSKLFMKGVNTVQSLFPGIDPSNAWELGGTNIRISGNIQTLLGNEKQDSVGNGAFGYLFWNSPLVDAGELMLPATTLASNCYSYMFDSCESLTQAPALPATTLAKSCYYSMFDNCKSLTQAPALPATTLASRCYYNMFRDCKSLTQAPVLPATTLASECYARMFDSCESLTQAPVLPATTLANSCYYSMFCGCTSLKQAPALPATTLEGFCYYSMFDNCKSLTQAPALPATTLADSCYSAMFFSCTKLNYIKCLATDVKEVNTSYWVSGVASSGTFVKNRNESNWPSGDNGIPSGWTVQNA